jgi:cold shock CspA family protein
MAIDVAHVGAVTCWYVKGFGFIKPSDGTPDVYFVRSSLPKDKVGQALDIGRGQRVEFVYGPPGQKGKGPAASRVWPID